MGDSMYILYVGPIPQSHTQVAGGLANDSKWQVIESFKCAISQRTATKIRWLQTDQHSDSPLYNP